jgi:hypothetical protein
VADGDVSLKYRLLGHDDGASRAFDKVGKSAEGLHRTMTTVGRVLGAVAAGGFLALGAAMVKGVKDAESYQTLQLKTQAVLKSTGNVAGTSVKQVDALAASLETMSGVDEELIVNSQNVLLTFTKVRDEAGKGNDVFTQGTKAALDLSVAMGEDLQSATVQVGKALNDPIKGMTALQRVGVSFTAAQKDQIAAMLKSGNTMGAQKVILGELNKEFGGAAKAAGSGFGGAMARVQDVVGDTFRSIGQKLLPKLTDLGNWLASTGIPKVIEFGKKLATELGKIDWSAILGKAGDIASSIKDKLAPVAEAIVNTAKTWGGKIISGIQTGLSTGNWAPLGKTLGDGLVKAIGSMAQGAGALAGAIGRFFASVDWEAVGRTAGKTAFPFAIGFAATLFDGLFDAARNHPMDTALFILAFIPLGKLASAFGPVKNLIEKLPFGEWITKALGATAGKAWDAIVALLKFMGRAFVEGWKLVLPGVDGFFNRLWINMSTRIGVMALELVAKGKEMIAGLGRGIGIMTAFVVKDARDLIADILRPFATAGSWLISKGVAFVKGLGQGIARNLGTIAAAAAVVITALLKPFNVVPDRMREVGKQAMAGLGKGILDYAPMALNPAAAIGGKIGDVISGALGIHSPSRVTMKIGQNVMAGLEIGLRTKAPSVYAFLERFAQRIGDMKVTAGTKNALERLVVGLADDMQRATGKLDKVKDQIKAQQAKVADLIKARNDYAAQLSSGVSGGGSIAGIQLAQDTTDEEGNTVKADQAGGFLASLKAKADAIKKFGSDMNKLRAEGLSQDVLQQIAQAGLDTGGALATALATATPATIKSINGLSQKVKSESDTFGKTWAGQMYDSGIKAAEGIMKGLQSRESAIMATIRALANEMVAEIKRTLKIKSPSGVMADEVGAMIPAGLIAGIQGGAGGVASAMASLVRVPQVGAVGVGLGQSIATGGVRGGDTHVHLHLQNGIVGDAQQVATYLSEAIRRSGARGSGLTFA